MRWDAQRFKRRQGVSLSENMDWIFFQGVHSSGGGENRVQSSL